MHPAHDGIEWRAQLVRGGRQEFILQAARIFGNPACLFGLRQRFGPLVERQVQLVQVDRGADPPDDGR